jgi:hypothetical protein
MKHHQEFENLLVYASREERSAINTLIAKSGSSPVGEQLREVLGTYLRASTQFDESTAKTERLLLNTTHEERNAIDTMVSKAGASSASELLRVALEQYAWLHEFIRRGLVIVLRNEEGRQQVGVPLPLRWNPAAVIKEDPAVEQVVRRPLEIRLTGQLLNRLKNLVAAGAAPSLTALVGFCLTVHELVLEYSRRGYSLHSQHPDGTLEKLEPGTAAVQPAEREPEPPRGEVHQRDKEGLVVLPEAQGIPLVWVLKHWEPSLKRKQVNGRRQIVKAIYLNVSRPMLVRDEPSAPEVMLDLLIDRDREDVLDYLVVTKRRVDMDLLKAAIRNKLAPHLPWSAFTPKQQTYLEKRIEYYERMHRDFHVDGSVDPTRPGSSPVWLVVRVIPLHFQHGHMKAIADRTHDTPSWLAQFADGTCDGWFLEPEGGAESTNVDGNFNEATRAMGGMARRQIEALKSLEEDYLFSPIILSASKKHILERQTAIENAAISKRPNKTRA